uniref:Uncharacterized protein n=1 Tax=Rhizophora mucronata TaxID=61149 RepID=A0A2P2JLP6_RHIMU
MWVMPFSTGNHFHDTLFEVYEDKPFLVVSCSVHVKYLLVYDSKFYVCDKVIGWLLFQQEMTHFYQ